MQIDPNDIAHQGHRDAVHAQLRGLFTDVLSRDEADHLLTPWLAAQPEYTAPTPDEVIRGVYAQHDGSGYLAIRKTDFSTLKAVWAAASAFYKGLRVTHGDLLSLKGAGKALWDLFGLLYALRSKGVELDAADGLLLLALGEAHAGASVGRVVELAPAYLETDERHSGEALRRLEALGLVSHGGGRWVSLT